MANAGVDQDIIVTLAIYQSIKETLENTDIGPVFQSREIKNKLTAETVILMLGRFRLNFKLEVKTYSTDQVGNATSYIIEIVKR